MRILLALSLFTVVITQDSCDIEVSGFDDFNPSVNGLYVRMGDFNGMSFYRQKLNEFFVYYNTDVGRWYISDELGSDIVFAKTDTNVTSPDLIEEWVVLKGQQFESDQNVQSLCFVCDSHELCGLYDYEYCDLSIQKCQDGNCCRNEHVRELSGIGCPYSCDFEGLTLGVCVGNFCMGQSGESCTETCKDHNRTCEAKFPHVSLETFHLFGECQTEPWIEQYWSCDQPAYVTRPDNVFYQHCAGYDDAPDEINCDCYDDTVARLCNCAPLVFNDDVLPTPEGELDESQEDDEGDAEIETEVSGEGRDKPDLPSVDSACCFEGFSPLGIYNGTKSCLYQVSNTRNTANCDICPYNLDELHYVLTFNDHNITSDILLCLNETHCPTSVSVTTPCYSSGACAARFQKVACMKRNVVIEDSCSSMQLAFGPVFSKNSFGGESTTYLSCELPPSSDEASDNITGSVDQES